MDLLPHGPTRELEVEWRPAGLRCRLRPRGLPEPAADVLAESTFLWLFGTSLALVGAVAIGLACVIATQPLEQPLALGIATSAILLVALSARAVVRWTRAHLFWEIELDGTSLTARHQLGPLPLETRRWPLEDVRAAQSDGGLGLFCGGTRVVLRTDEHPVDLRWLAGAIEHARRSRAMFWRQVLGRPDERQALMALLGRTQGGGGWGRRNTQVSPVLASGTKE